MGVFITAFAFNASRLRSAMDVPLWQLLIQLRQVPPDPDLVPFSVFDPERRQRYAIDDARRILRLTPFRPNQVLDEAELARVPVLQQTASQYLTGPLGHSLALSSLLSNFARGAAPDISQELTDCHRRWWIGSLLAAAQASPALPPDDFSALRDLVARILRVYDCGFPLDAVPLSSARTLPFLAVNDDDCFLNVFDPTEAAHLVDLLDRLLRFDARFGPPQNDGQATDPDGFDWNPYVRARIAEFMKWRSLSPPHDHLITFIG